MSCIPTFSLAVWNVSQPAKGHGATLRLESGECCLISSFSPCNPAEEPFLQLPVSQLDL